MASLLLDGQRSWEADRDDEGHRTYKVSFIVACDFLDGPATALQTPGLPVYGTYWIIDNDVDLWAWCRWETSVKQVIEKPEPNNYFELTFTFSTKPPNKNDRTCKENEVEDPLLELPKINGSFVVYHEEATQDRFGNPLLNSAFERLRGPQVEFDANRPQVKIEMNVPVLDLAQLEGMSNTVNDAPLWGMPPRCIKLSEIEWERKFYGSCYVYFTLHLTFDIRFDTFDRNLLDESTKVLNGHWDGTTGAWILDPIDGQPPNNQNPQHFKRFKDRAGENIKGILNGAGLPAGVQIGTSTAGAVYFMSLTNPNQKGVAPPSASWLTIPSPVSSDIRTWTALSPYDYGETVFNNADLNFYICIAAVGIDAVQLGHLQSPDQDKTHWKFLASGANGVNISNAGIYDNTKTYLPGNYVSFKSSTVEGYIHVEKYPESDFTQLGIPLTFQ